MKHVFAILVVIIAVASVAWKLNQSDPTTSQQAEYQDPNSIERLQSKLAEFHRKMIIDKEKLQAIESLLVQRGAEYDTVNAELNQLIQRSDKTSKEIKAELDKKESELDSQLWFQEARNVYHNLKALGRDIIVLTLQKDRIKKRQLTCEQKYQELQRLIEIKRVSGEDPELVSLIVDIEVAVKESESDGISDGEQKEIEIKTDKLLSKSLENSVSRIPGLELKSVENLPALPEFSGLVKKSVQPSTKILFDRVKNDCNKIVEKVKKEAAQRLKSKEPESACSCWLEALNQLNAAVNNAYSSEKFPTDIFKDYLKAIEECKRETLRIMATPYVETFSKCVRDMENKDPDFDSISESLEGLLRIEPKLTRAEVETMSQQFEVVRSLLGYLIKQNDWRAKVKANRLESVLEKAEKVNAIELNRCMAEEKAEAEEAAQKPKEDISGVQEKPMQTNKAPLQTIKAKVKLQVKTDEAAAKRTTNEKSTNEKKANEEGAFPKAGDRIVKTINGVDFAFRFCPAGSFMMGSPDTEENRHNDETQREETLDGFWILETMVTVGMFKAFVDDTNYISVGDAPWGWIDGKWDQDFVYSWRNPGFDQDDNYPVTCVSWYDAIEFCKWLSIKTGQNIHVPSEVQFEYACRAGSTGAYAGRLDKMAWYDGNSGTHPVGAKEPNPWGLYDMHGLAWEWTLWEADSSNEKSSYPLGSSRHNFRVIRGGGWNSKAQECRSANRIDYDPRSRNCYLGFRCVKESFSHYVVQSSEK